MSYLQINNLFRNHLQDIRNTVFSKSFTQDLEEIFLQRGIQKSNIAAIYLTGSSLYLDQYHDFDLLILVYQPFWKMRNRVDYKIEGRDADLIFYNLDKLDAVVHADSAFTWIASLYDSILIYGTPLKNMKDYDILNHPELWSTVADRFYANFLSPSEIPLNSGHKRYWNFLLFYYKLMNQSHKISNTQYLEIQAAHDCRITKQECLYKYNKLQQYIQYKIKEEKINE